MDNDSQEKNNILNLVLYLFKILHPLHSATADKHGTCRERKLLISETAPRIFFSYNFSVFFFTAYAFSDAC